MKYKTCPDCGAHLDHNEPCDCKEKEDTPDAAGMPSKDVNANDVNSLSNLFPNVNDCFRLREVRELTGVQAKDLSKLVQSRFPKFTRQIMSQCESYDKYGCLPHPDVLRIICEAYDIKLDSKPVRKGENYKRKLGKKVTLRMTELVSQRRKLHRRHESSLQRRSVSCSAGSRFPKGMDIETVVQIVATLLITLIGVLGTWLTATIAKKHELANIAAATDEASSIEAATE